MTTTTTTTNKIDLRKCKPGDKLRIRTTHAWLGAIPNPPIVTVTYVGVEDPIVSDYPHIIEYSNGSKGTRSHGGLTFINNPRADDPDVLEVL